MRYHFLAFALLALPLPALADCPVVFQATSANQASGFKTMAECETALGRPVKIQGKAGADQNERRGTVFNRAAGNTSLCEMVAGEPVITVYPAGQKARVAR